VGLRFSDIENYYTIMVYLQEQSFLRHLAAPMLDSVRVTEFRHNRPKWIATIKAARTIEKTMPIMA
jgi:hypothetical protein